MAVTSVAEVWAGRSGNRDIKNVRNYRRTFLVLTDNMLDGPFEVGSIAGNPLPGPARIPLLFEYYKDTRGVVDLGTLCQKLTPRQAEEPFAWYVDADYSSKIDNPEQAQKGQTDDNPLNRPAIVKWSMSKYQKPVDAAFDANGEDVPIVNSANEHFDPAPEIDDSRIILTVDRNEPPIDPSVMIAYQDATNADDFFGAGPGQAKIEELSGESGFEN